jgi:ribosomal protein S18 acetylase RimI-like enzyme
VRIIRCHPSRFDALVAFVAAHNPQPQHHIGYFGLTPEDIRLSLRMFNWPFDRAARLAVVGNRIAGVLAVDIDKELGRAWLYGPLIDLDDKAAGGASEAAHSADSPAATRHSPPATIPPAPPLPRSPALPPGWGETADTLYAAVAARLPVGIGEHEMFVDTANVNCRAFAARHGFATHGQWAIYFITPDRLARLPEATAEAWDERFAPQLEALHNRLFPGSNYTLTYMRQEWAEKGALLLVATEGDTLTGYFFGRYEAEAGEGYVDLVGVDESRRRTGLGRRLMLAGLSRLRGAAGLRQVNLSVAAGNEAALALYDALGFVRERDMIAFRRRNQEE